MKLVKNPHLLDALLRQYISQNSGKILMAKQPPYPPYEIMDTIFPKVEDMMYNGKSILEQLQLCIKKNKNTLDSVAEAMIFFVYSYLMSCYFKDNAIKDKQRMYVEEALAETDQEVWKFYRDSKLRWTNITRITATVPDGYANMFYGFDFEDTSNVKKLSAEVVAIMSAPGKTDTMLYREDDFPEEKKMEAGELTTKLAKAICIAFIEHYKC